MKFVPKGVLIRILESTISAVRAKQAIFFVLEENYQREKSEGRVRHVSYSLESHSFEFSSAPLGLATSSKADRQRDHDSEHYDVSPANPQVLNVKIR